MSGYLLRRRPDGAYVADVAINPTGSSYTRSLQYARVYATRERADGDRCVENESVIAVDDVVGKGGR